MMPDYDDDYDYRTPPGSVARDLAKRGIPACDHCGIRQVEVERESCCPDTGAREIGAFCWDCDPWRYWEDT